MSEMSKKARAAMREKARKMAGGTDPHQKVDASSWSPSEPLNADVQTGPRPVSPQAKLGRKRGGKVGGHDGAHHAGRKPRARGGRSLGEAYENRDVKAASNEGREGGGQHDGGMKRGGRAKRQVGGPLAGALSEGINGQGRMNFNYPGVSRGLIGLKRGGAAHVGEAALKQHRIEHNELGRGKHAHGGASVTDGTLEGTRPTGGRLAKKHGGHLSAEERRELPKKDFGLPGKRGYPMEDKGHAKAAKSRASAAEHEGRMSKSTEEKIDAKADHVLARAHGGRTSGKGKMNVNVIIASHPGGMAGAGAAPPPAPHPAAAPVPMPSAPPPSVMPVAGMPTLGAAMGAQPPGPPPGGVMPQMPRKRGGRTPDAGSGSGLGRLEKVREYGAKARKQQPGTYRRGGKIAGRGWDAHMEP